MEYINAVCCGCQIMIKNGAFYSVKARMYLMRSHNFAETNELCEGSLHTPQFTEGVEVDDGLGDPDDDWI